jgi:hypothetical protein
MPTGYTHDLETRNYDLKGWIKESLARGMGICVTMRDSGTMTEQQILAELEKGSGTYYLEKIESTRKELKRLQVATSEEVYYAQTGVLDAARAKYASDLNEYKTKKALHIDAIESTKKLLSKAVETNQSEVVINTIKFGLDQLIQALSWDYGTPPPEPKIFSQTVDQWKEERIESLKKDLAYYTNEKTKDDARFKERIAAYKELVSFVNSTNLELQ